MASTTIWQTLLHAVLVVPVTPRSSPISTIVPLYCSDSEYLVDKDQREEIGIMARMVECYDRRESTSTSLWTYSLLRRRPGSHQGKRMLTFIRYRQRLRIFCVHEVQE